MRSKRKSPQRLGSVLERYRAFARLRFRAFGHDAEMEIALQRAWGRQDSGVQETGLRQRETDANERLHSKVD